MHIMTPYGLLDEAPAGTPDSLADVFRHQRAVLEKPLDALRDDLAAIAADPSLSDVGRKTSFVAAHRRAAARLEAAIATKLPGVNTLPEWRADSAAYRARIVAEQRALPHDVPPHREQIIYQALMALDPIDRLQEAFAAAERDDRELLFVLRNAPWIAAPLDAQQIAHVEDAHRERHFPTYAAGLAMRQAIEDTLELNEWTARQTLQGQGRIRLPFPPPPADDPAADDAPRTFDADPPPTTLPTP